jgi:hypothetical protein
MEEHRPKKLLDQVRACPACPERSRGELAGRATSPAALCAPWEAPLSRCWRRFPRTAPQPPQHITVGRCVVELTRIYELTLREPGPKILRVSHTGLLSHLFQKPLVLVVSTYPKPGDHIGLACSPSTSASASSASFSSRRCDSSVARRASHRASSSVYSWFPSPALAAWISRNCAKSSTSDARSGGSLRTIQINARSTFSA